MHQHGCISPHCVFTQHVCFEGAGVDNIGSKCLLWRQGWTSSSSPLCYVGRLSPRVVRTSWKEQVQVCMRMLQYVRNMFAIHFCIYATWSTCISCIYRTCRNHPLQLQISWRIVFCRSLSRLIACRHYLIYDACNSILSYVVSKSYISYMEVTSQSSSYGNTMQSSVSSVTTELILEKMWMAKTLRHVIGRTIH